MNDEFQTDDFMKFLRRAGLLIFLTGTILDEVTTVWGLFFPPVGMEFQEVGNVFIVFLMNGLGLGIPGFIVGDALTWIIEILLIFWTYFAPNRRILGLTPVADFTWLFIFGIVHWEGALHNASIMS